ncbi:MAG: RagB/SusD family nutrient uptake outer membrane protein [Bacteroidales bacterium]
MNRKNIYILLALLPLIFVGCADLDTLPEDDIVTGSQKEDVVENDPSKAAAGVNAIFSQFSQYMPNYSALGRSRHNDFGYPSLMLFTDANGNDVVSSDNGYNWTGNNLDYTDRSVTSYECQIIWNNMYSSIYTANNLIGSISPDVEDATLQYNLAQGLAIRAFDYWILAQLYQFNYVGNQSKPCVPIITDVNAEEVAIAGGAPRSTVEEVYALIKSDIDKAVELLESAAKGGVTRADKRYIDLSVAYGIRARIKLTMQEWGAAAADAKLAIDNSSSAPANFEDINNPSFWSINETNWMWGIVVSESDDVVTSGIVNWISHMGSLNYGYANYSGGKQINKSLFNTIPDTDARKGWWLNADTVSANLNTEQAATAERYGCVPYTQMKFAPYKDVVRTSINSNDLPLMRIEEMYLIKAEAEAMSGGDGKSTLENFVKTYRDPAYVCAASSPETIQEEVFRQRRIELWGEGLNWFDIMRLNKAVDRRGGGYPNATMVFNIPAGDDLLLWPIPEKEILANPTLNVGDNNPTAPTPQPVPDID